MPFPLCGAGGRGAGAVTHACFCLFSYLCFPTAPPPSPTLTGHAKEAAREHEEGRQRGGKKRGRGSCWFSSGVRLACLAHALHFSHSPLPFSHPHPHAHHAQVTGIRSQDHPPPLPSKDGPPHTRMTKKSQAGGRRPQSTPLLLPAYPPRHHAGAHAQGAQAWEVKSGPGRVV